MLANKQQQNNEKVANENSYEITFKNGREVLVKHNGQEFNGKLNNTKPTTHLKFNGQDILLPRTIGEIKTTFETQEEFDKWLKTMQGKTLEFNKNERAPQQHKTTLKVIDYINENEFNKKQYNELKLALEKASTEFNEFMQKMTTEAKQKHETQKLTTALKTTELSRDQMQAIINEWQKQLDESVQ